MSAENAFWEWYLKRFYENYLRPYTCTLTKGTIKAQLCLTLHAKIDRSDRFNQIPGILNLIKNKQSKEKLS